MERIMEHEFLEFNPDTLEAVRKDVNMDVRSIDHLEDWLKKQAHFVRKEYSRDYLEKTFITCKGSVERAKQRLDSLATFKTLMPEFFVTEDAYMDYEMVKEVMDFAILPKQTTDNTRVCLLRFTSDGIESHQVIKFYKSVIMVCEYLKRFDYTSGFSIISDCRQVNPLNLVSSLAPMSLKKLFTLLIEGYGMRLKGLHFVTKSKTIDVIISIFKQVLSAKLRNRIHVHEDMDPVYHLMKKEIFPKEYGGDERPLQELHKKWIDVLNTEDNLDYFREMKNAKTIENNRQSDTFNEQYMGVPGSFRMLSVD